MKQRALRPIAWLAGGLIALILLLPFLVPSLFGPNIFMPHAHCYLGRTDVMLLHGGSDLLIGLAYMSISITLFLLLRKVNNEIPFGWMISSFGLFIIACGLTHFMSIWTLWNPTYWLSGSLKGFTAIVSIITAVTLPPTVPKIISTIRSARASEQRRVELEKLNERVNEFKRERDALLARIEGGDIKREVATDEDPTTTEQRQAIDGAMSDIRSLQSRFDMLWHSNVMAMGISHLDGRISDANDRFLEMIGYDREELEKGDIDFNLLTPDGARAQTDQAVAALRDRGFQAPFEKEYLRKDGTHVQVLVGAARVAGTDDENLFFALDLSESKEAEQKIRTLNRELEERVEHRTIELEQANRDLQAFSYSVSHDLRAPLRSISGFSRILAEDLDGLMSKESRDLFERIQRNVNRMEQIITALLGLSRVTRVEIEITSFDAAPVMREILQRFADERAGTRPTIEVPEVVPVDADPALFRVMMENLLGNAWKFSSGKEVPRITIETSITSENQREILIRDNGDGFDPENAAKMFEPFRRLHSEKQFPGTGVGLSIVKAVVQRHGGTITADSDGQTGATFTIRLPRSSNPDRGDAVDGG